MKVAHDLQIQDRCQDCQCKNDSSFCNLPAADRDAFRKLKIPKTYPKGAFLFIEGQTSIGVFTLCTGRIKLSTCSKDGKIIILGISEPGDVLGLSAAINGTDYEMTAEVLEPASVNFIRAWELLRFLQTHPSAGLNAARQLSRNYQTAYRQICSLGLSDSVSDKLAKLFLGWSAKTSGGGGAIHLKNFFTHEEIAEMIGTSRETVTRALKYFREQQLVTLKGSDLYIHDKQRLQASIGARSGPRSM